MKWVVSFSISSEFGTVIRDAASYGAVPEDAGGAPGRRDGLLQGTEVAAARAGGAPQHVRGLAPPTNAKKFEALSEQFPPFLSTLYPSHADVGEGQRFSRRDVSYGRDFDRTIRCRAEAAVRRAIMSHRRRRLVQRRLLLELVGEGVADQQHLQNHVFLERCKRLRSC